ncbi:MAG: DUF4292 domain-containing protein [Candidatus Marinimicrobia bacterium]|nr:DUF4292 domain-containing protein [Candidatus Neomarinimicrobiota bacterium]MCF7829825.1 DUF4292 domain-containing protein [Candidatus Neomarinimicrobiota bacterium]MCF7881742.1 DUF4292 domain-containing protein [Candidatus Neomarinimicrobiota bacterium]
MPTDQTPQQLSEEIEADFNTIKSFQGSATLTLDTPEQSGRIRSQIMVTPFTLAIVEIKTPFGGQFGTLEVRKNYLSFYNAKGELDYIGAPDELGIPGMPAIMTGRQDLLRILIGAINFPSDATTELIQDEMTESSYILRYQTEDATLQYWVDPMSRKITKYEETNKSTGVETTITLTDYAEVDGIKLPRTIQVEQSALKRFFSINYHEINIQRNGQAHAS